MADSEFYEAVTDTQAAVTANVTDLLTFRLRTIWENFDGWYDDGLVATKIMESVDLVERATGQTRKQADAYLRQVYRRLGLPFPTDSAESHTDYGRRGVAPEEVWNRPAVQYRYAESTGASAPDALQAALARVATMAAQDVQLAQRDQQVQVLSRTEAIIGYRRIVHPEWSRTGLCGLCLVAADRVYRSDELMPIHANCKCTVLPMTATNDPGLSLNTADLNRLYEAAGSTAAEDLSAIRIKDYASGELGPVITRAGVDVETGATREQLGPRALANKVTGSKARKVRLPRRTREKLEDFELEEARVEIAIRDMTRTGGLEPYIANAEKKLADVRARRDRFIQNHHWEFEDAA